MTDDDKRDDKRDDEDDKPKRVDANGFPVVDPPKRQDGDAPPTPQRRLG